MHCPLPAPAAMAKHRLQHEHNATKTAAFQTSRLQPQQAVRPCRSACQLLSPAPHSWAGSSSACVGLHAAARRSTGFGYRHAERQRRSWQRPAAKTGAVLPCQRGSYNAPCRVCCAGPAIVNPACRVRPPQCCLATCRCCGTATSQCRRVSCTCCWAPMGAPLSAASSWYLVVFKRCMQTAMRSVRP